MSMIRITVGARACRIADLQDPKYSLVDLSQDVDAIHEHFGWHEDIKPFGGFLVEVLDGEYGEVWGFHGSVPYLDKSAQSIQRKLFEAGSEDGFQAFTANHRFRYYEISTSFMIERMKDGKVSQVGDGVGLFWDEKAQKSIPVSTVDFYEAFRVSAINDDEDDLESAYFGCQTVFTPTAYRP